MNKLFNKFMRRVISFFANNDLAQELTGGVSGEMMITPGMPELIRAAGAEGCILLANNGVLPLDATTTVSVFGRVQRDYFYVGYGSGGDVRTPYQVNLIEGLRNNGKIKLNEDLAAIYEVWCSKNEADQGFWGHWPRYYPEMPLKEEVVKAAADRSDVAIIVIGRAAGEDRENVLKKGSYYLTDNEIKMLDLVTANFNKVIVIINSGNIIDMAWTEKYGDKLSSILFAWQGGMESGNAIADVLAGTVNPCGKLTDTIARRYEDYPSGAFFGNKEGNNYVEDIFVGYRYFETFAPNKVLYPFGFGLSYTTFKIACSDVSREKDEVILKVHVANTGNLPGKEIVQVYCSTPQGKLGKPAKVLVAFDKTELLSPGKSAEVMIKFNIKQLASYDDSGVTGKKSAYILEPGNYEILLGNSVRETIKVWELTIALDELEVISRGEGVMNSSLGVRGNAGALGGVTESLRAKGIPAVITTDGPAGIRVKKTCSLLPCGTLLACTWNTKLIQDIFHKVGEEMLDKGSDMILSPGMNIHRNPLCGRNFEYYSEDPLISGKIAAAAIIGIQHDGLSACPKHFACNNQETNRNYNDSRVSERALREIYLKGFEIVVKEANPQNIMTSYNKINGVWSHYSYELVTSVLRGEWGYQGNVITDWWMRYASSPEFPQIEGNAYRVRAQVDVLMPGGRTALSKNGKNDGTLLKTYGKKDGITLGEMQRVAANILKYVMNSSAMDR
ncbi:hypothetical protein P22_3164 [Propionispora sp. 2/2-37]|uniref:glycoside hydrolase family 3 protein n=1 Tax=Propionispora sp. 2/2-37 TaxID=1677858 RepID=UPI0006BB8EF2|nr:glycoside hydrolase family 3 protein [Propionispora sp. 2/2-37]CUH97038.1 hypothetical protein P22_3164 [Propionispora sp. 2/2-37]